MTSIDREKRAIREAVWTRLEESDAVSGSVHGKIPDFVGAEAAAARLADLEVWKRAHIVKIVPDRPQEFVRARALADGKIVYMAVPKLAAEEPFLVLDPRVLGVSPAEAADRETAMRLGRLAALEDLTRVDLVVCGSVAVDRRGARLGKGAGYADIEVALLTAAGLLTAHTPITTTVHDLQVVEDELPELGHDFSLDFIVTPSRVITCGPSRRPGGVDWETMPSDKIAAIPVLKRLASLR